MVTLLDLGGKSFEQIMLQGESTRLESSLSPIALVDGFVLSQSDLPSLPSQGEAPVEGLSECLPGCVGCLPVCVCVSVCVSVCLSVCLSACLSVRLSVRLSVCLSVCILSRRVCQNACLCILCLVCVCVGPSAIFLTQCCVSFLLRPGTREISRTTHCGCLAAPTALCAYSLRILLNDVIQSHALLA